MISHIKKLKNNYHMIPSKGTEKALDKIEHQFIIKTLIKIGIKRIFHNILKAIYPM